MRCRAARTTAVMSLITSPSPVSSLERSTSTAITASGPSATMTGAHRPRQLADQADKSAGELDEQDRQDET
jgi:hypothetical protein